MDDKKDKGSKPGMGTSFQKANPKAKIKAKEENPSHAEVIARIERYHHLDPKEVPDFSLPEIKQKYEKEVQKRDADRNKADIYYGQGRGKGLPQADYAQLQRDREEADQKLRNSILGESKAHYHNNGSLTQQFKDPAKHSKGKDPGKGRDRER